MNTINFEGLSVTVMGLGLHGGGLAAATYASRAGASVTVTDLRDEKTLRESLDKLPGTCKVVAGRHEKADFSGADIVIKNPAVPRTTPLLQHARAVTSDIAIFLAARPKSGSQNPPLVTVTGTKGKSTCSSAAAYILSRSWPQTRLGGNITVSPLVFLPELAPEDPVVLELSSFQLGDLVFFRSHNNRQESVLPEGLPQELFFPVVPASAAIITNIFEDHQDYYHSMVNYVRDKKEVYANLLPDGVVILDEENPWTREFVREVEGLYGEGTAVVTDYPSLPGHLTVPGRHNRKNLSMAAMAARHIGVPDETVREAVAAFPGIPHRLETVLEAAGVRWVNDTAATIPEAAEAAVAAFLEESSAGELHLIAGGSDKGLDLAPLERAIDRVVQAGGAVALLEGSATSRLTEQITPAPPVFPSMEAAASYLLSRIRKHPGPAVRSVILLSPGCASFGMFRNEFHRGHQFREVAQQLTE